MCNITSNFDSNLELSPAVIKEKGDNKSERKQSSSHYLRQGKQKVEKIPTQHPTSQRPICTKGKVWFWQFFNLFIRPRVEDFSCNQVGGGELCPFSSKLVHLFCLLPLFILICLVFSFLSNQTPPFPSLVCLSQITFVFVSKIQFQNISVV